MLRKSNDQVITIEKSNLIEGPRLIDRNCFRNVVITPTKVTVPLTIQLVKG